MASDAGDRRAAGILWMLATMFCFISLDAIMKHLLESLPLVQVTWGRFFFATIVAVAICGRRLPSLAISRAPGLQALRSVLLMTTTGLFNAGIRTVPLATGTTIMFLSPILITLLSIPLLGEKVGARRWAGIRSDLPARPSWCGRGRKAWAALGRGFCFCSPPPSRTPAINSPLARSATTIS